MSDGYWILATIYERNLFYQQIHFKWRSLCHILGVLRNFRKTVYTSVILLVYLIDFVLGISIFYYVLYANPQLGNVLQTSISLYTTAMLDWTEQLISWLMGVPAGLKLNTPLNDFLGTKFLTILRLWKYFYFEFIARFLNWIVWFIIHLSVFGISLSMTLFHDFMKFLNLSLICFFIISTRVFLLQVSALKSLARLFMGKKWNVLKNRVDSCNYDTNQLLMGTVLFTVLLFLLPTTGMYFVIFLLLKTVQFLLQFVLRVATIAVNKTTVILWGKLVASLRDDPVTKMRLSISFPSNQANVNNVATGLSDSPSTASMEESSSKPCIARVAVKWNGCAYSVEEAKDLLGQFSTDSILQELKPSPGKKLELEHAMLNFMPKLP